jgi:ABC-2 type transport system ATP-binding protein
VAGKLDQIDVHGHLRESVDEPDACVREILHWAIAGVREGSPSQDFAHAPQNLAGGMKGVPVELRRVTRHFRKGRGITDVSFEVRPGEVLGLLGPNGAGKTTTMRVLTGFLTPDEGQVAIDGADAAADPVAGRRLIGYMPEASALYGEMSVDGFLAYCARLRGVTRDRRRQAVSRAVQQAGLHGRAGDRIGTLSRGLRQRVALAQALVHDPPVLILDEPTAGLDPQQVAEARELIARLGRSRTVLLASHLLSEVSQLCRRVVVLDEGRVLAVEDVARLTGRCTDGVTRLEARVAGDPSLAVRSVTGLAGVSAAEARGAVLIVQGTGVDLARRVSASLVGAGLGLEEMRTVGGTSLEEAYLRLVREEQ